MRMVNYTPTSMLWKQRDQIKTLESQHQLPSILDVFTFPGKMDSLLGENTFKMWFLRLLLAGKYISYLQYDLRYFRNLIRSSRVFLSNIAAHTLNHLHICFVVSWSVFEEQHLHPRTDRKEDEAREIMSLAPPSFLSRRGIRMSLAQGPVALNSFWSPKTQQSPRGQKMIICLQKCINHETSLRDK